MEPGPKKSSAVNLAIMGAALTGAVAVPALFSGTDVQRNRYASREACAADYSETQCNPDMPINGAIAGAGTYYYGPWYRSDYRARTASPDDPGPGRYYRSGGVSGFSSGATSSAPAGVETGTRGGFGRSGRVSARGG